MKKIFFLLSISLLILSACPDIASAEKKLSPGIHTIFFPEKNGNNSNLKMVPVDIFIPKGKKITGDILVLPGWSFSRTRWHKETDILKYAEELGFRLIFPEMSVSSYESEYFPETTMKWSATPGGEWIKSVLLPLLSADYGILKRGGNNFIFGLSTGGRGVLLVSLQNPDRFSGGATLSGDCDQFLMPDDKLMAALYGEYKYFKSRWESVDNPMFEIKKGNWKMPLYIGHGKKDAVSIFSQSELLYETIKIKYPNLSVVFNSPEDADHDFKYWKSEVPAVMNFFHKITKAK